MDHVLKTSWRNKKIVTGIAILLIIITASISIFLSLIIAHNQAVSKETKHLREVTSGVLMRMSTTRAQFSNVVNHFSTVAEKEACLPKQVQKMQEFNVAGFFLQGVAHIRDNQIICSSISELLDGMVLGKPYRIEPDGTKVWSNIKIADWQDRHLVIFEKSGWAIMFVPSHAIEALGNSEVAIGVFSIQSHRLYTAKGEIATEWLQRYQGKQALTFIDKERQMLVYIAPNQLNVTAVVAAIPLKDINDDIVTFIQILIPLSLIVGLLLSGLFIYMQRTRYSTKSAI